MHKKDCSGFILPTTLIVFALISLVVIANLGQIVLYQKVVSERKVTHHQFYALEHLAVQLMTNLTQLSCKQSGMVNHDVAIEILIHGQGCLLKDRQVSYHYLIEDLGVYPCLAIIHQNKEEASHHYRLTVLQDDTIKWVQIRVASLGGRSDCLGAKKRILPGALSWRYG